MLNKKKLSFLEKKRIKILEMGSFRVMKVSKMFFLPKSQQYRRQFLFSLAISKNHSCRQGYLVLNITRAGFQHTAHIFLILWPEYHWFFLKFLAVFTNILAQKTWYHGWYWWNSINIEVNISMNSGCNLDFSDHFFNFR